MPINQIYLGDRLLMDLTQDTVKPNNLEKGKTAHDSSGAIIIGELELPSGTININNNGVFTVKDFEKASVNVAIPSGYIKPEGAITITENGEHIVTSFQKAIVNVQSSNDATATANDILLGKTAYVNNVKVEGTIETFDGSMIGASEVEFETWTFTLEDGTIIEKKVLAGDLDD